MAIKGTIVKVSGPLIVADGMADVQMYDVVRVSEKKLIGEVIELRSDRASIQVYEETGGIGPGEPVESTGAPLTSVPVRRRSAAGSQVMTDSRDVSRFCRA